MHDPLTGSSTTSPPRASAPWRAPAATGPVIGAVRVPGSKSQSNRALVLAALSGAGCTVTGAAASRDTALMVGALAALGVPIRGTGERIEVGSHDGFRGGCEVDVGLAGTVMRFMPPVAALATGPVRFDGDPRARERPMGPVLDALRALGARIRIHGAAGALPFTLDGTGGLLGGEVVLDASGSSQFVSGLLLSGARFEKGLTVRHHGPPVPSLPHIRMTVDMLRSAGVVVDDSETNTWRVAPGWIAGRDWTVEPDMSNASVFLAAAAATGGRVTVLGWPTDSLQPGNAILGILERFGCTVTQDAGGVTVAGPDRLTGVDVDLHDVGELAPTVAALAAVASSPSSLRGIAHLRGHETDRLAALATELRALGGQADETADGLLIRPARLRAPSDRPWRAYADHRMATAGALLGLVVPDVLVDDIGCTDKTLPEFASRWLTLVTRTLPTASHVLPSDGSRSARSSSFGPAGH